MNAPDYRETMESTTLFCIRESLLQLPILTAEQTSRLGAINKILRSRNHLTPVKRAK